MPKFYVGAVDMSFPSYPYRPVFPYCLAEFVLHFNFEEREMIKLAQLEGEDNLEEKKKRERESPLLS